MHFTVTCQKTLAAESSLLFKIQPSHAIRLNDGKVKVYEMGVVCRIALCIAYPVRVMACRAWRLLVHDMFFMFFKALVVEDAYSAMAFITELISIGIFRSIVGSGVIPFKEIFVI